MKSGEGDSYCETSWAASTFLSSANSARIDASRARAVRPAPLLAGSACNPTCAPINWTGSSARQGPWRSYLGGCGGLLVASPDGVALLEEGGHALLRIVRECILGHHQLALFVGFI